SDSLLLAGPRVGPDGALISSPLDGLKAFVHESLHTPAVERLAGVKVAFRVDCDAVHTVELTGLPSPSAEARQHLERLTIENPDLHVAAVCEEDVFLLRVPRERNLPHRSLVQRLGHDELLFDELALRREHLNPIVHAIADVDKPNNGRES